MSLADKKGGLFGNASSSSSDAKASKPVSKTAGKSFLAITSVSSAVKTKKTKEAKECEDAANKMLKTSVFQWSPDHVGAAPLFESASACYKAAEDFESAKSMLVKAAESHDATGASAAAAVALTKAADIAQNQTLPGDAAKLFENVAEKWGLYGDMPKCADAHVKAAKQYDLVGNTKMTHLQYKQAGKYSFPEDAVKSQDKLKAIHPQVIDFVKDWFTFLLRSDNLKEGVLVGQRAAALFAAQGLESSVSKMMAAVIVVHLALGDVVQADRLFLDYLGNATFIRSKECQLAEKFVMAYKLKDVEMLEAAQKSVEVNFLEREVQLLAKRISLLRVAKAEKHTANTVDESTLVSVPASKVQDTATDAVSAPAPATAENVAVDVPTVTADEPVKSSSPVPYTADDDDDDDEIDLT